MHSELLIDDFAEAQAKAEPEGQSVIWLLKPSLEGLGDVIGGVHPQYSMALCFPIHLKIE